MALEWVKKVIVVCINISIRGHSFYWEKNILKFYLISIFPMAIIGNVCVLQGITTTLLRFDSTHFSRFQRRFFDHQSIFILKIMTIVPLAYESKCECNIISCNFYIKKDFGELKQNKKLCQYWKKIIYLWPVDDVTEGSTHGCFLEN